MPCLNEEELLESTCRSLGFGQSKVSTLENLHLILVDNGSDDDTLAVMEHVKERSPPGSVQIVREMERGYVPARHTGAWARRLAGTARPAGLSGRRPRIPGWLRRSPARW